MEKREAKTMRGKDGEGGKDGGKAKIVGGGMQREERM